MISLIRGSDRDIRVQLKKQSGEPFDLTSCSAIKATFAGEDGLVYRTLAESAISYVNRAGGVINVKLSKTFTATLKVAERQTFQVELVIGADTRIVQLYEALTVEPSLEEED